MANLFFNLLFYLFIPLLIGVALMERCDIIWKQRERQSGEERRITAAHEQDVWFACACVCVCVSHISEAKDRQHR